MNTMELLRATYEGIMDPFGTLLWLIHVLLVRLIGKNHYVIAVDATSRMGGGILLDKSAKKLYYYSVDFKDKFRFPRGTGPDKFEMVNAYIGLSIFSEYLSWFRNSEVILKTDNKFNEFSYEGPDNKGYKILQEEIRKKVGTHPFYGRIDWLSRERPQIKIADFLSRGEIDEAKELISRYYHSTYEVKQIDNAFAVSKVGLIYEHIQDLSQAYPPLKRIVRRVKNHNVFKNVVFVLAICYCLNGFTFNVFHLIFAAIAILVS